MKSNAEKDIKIIEGGAKGMAKKIQANAASQAAQQVIGATTRAYQALGDKCGFNP